MPKLSRETWKWEVSAQVPGREAHSGHGSFLPALPFFSSHVGAMLAWGLAGDKAGKHLMRGGWEVRWPCWHTFQACILAPSETEFYGIWLITEAVAVWCSTRFRRIHFPEMPPMHPIFSESSWLPVNWGPRMRSHYRPVHQSSFRNCHEHTESALWCC